MKPLFKREVITMEKERNYDTPRDCIDRFREEYEFLSNFYPAKLFFDGIIYDNSESAYQAQKLADPDARKQFAHLYADEAKRMGRKVEEILSNPKGRITV